MAATTPVGTVTFLFTDIEGSTRLWEQHPEEMREALARHDELMRACIEGHGGRVFKTVGDSFCAAFAVGADAAAASLAAQRALLAEPWPEACPIRVRMALHAGAADERGGDYFGRTLNRVARLLATGHGGQTLVSGAARELLRDDGLPAGAHLLDLGLHRLRDLERPEQVWQICHPDLPAAFLPLRSLDNPRLPNNLPLQVTSFVGRAEEMHRVEQILSGARLLTLTGSGGCGKTRLALQVAADALGGKAFPDGAWLAELAPLSDPSLVAHSVSQALGVKEQAGQPMEKTLTAHLGEKRLLIVLDNCEHLLEASARLSAALLRSCPNVRVLATSREPLGIAGEQVYRVPSLSLPDPEGRGGTDSAGEALFRSEAVRLFVERARAVRQDFTLSEEDAKVVGRLCRRLDGIPLALELAAARVRALSVAEIEARLDDRFRLLTGGDRAALPRQRTLRALVDWSYDLLTEPERTLLCRLPVFAGGWTLAAAERVCGFEPLNEYEVLDLLFSLVDKSLVVAEVEESAAAGRPGEATRYRLLETIRQYATAKRAEQGNDPDGEAARLSLRHRDFFLSLVEETAPHLQGADPGTWLDRLEEEHDNLRAALDACTNGAAAEDHEEAGPRLTTALYRFWLIRGNLSEGREFLERVLKAAGAGDARARTSSLAGALQQAGSFAYYEGDFAVARARFEESLAVYEEREDRAGVARLKNSLGGVAFIQADYVAARTFLEDSLRMCREEGDRRGTAMPLRTLGLIAFREGDLERARVLFEESLAAYRESGDLRGRALVLNNLGILAGDQEDFARAQTLYEESLSIARELGDKRGIALSLDNMGNSACARREYATARALRLESLAIFLDLGDRRSIAYSLEGLARVAWDTSETTRAVVLWGAASALRAEIGAPLAPGESAGVEEPLGEARSLLGEAEFSAAWERGRGLSVEDAASYARGSDATG